MSVLSALVDGQLRPYLRWWEAAYSSELAVGLVLGAVVAAMSGAFLFGVWHVVGGWMIKGNPRAGLFGLALATVTGVLLAVGHVTVGSRFRR
jgi:hypothetical protein